MGLTDMKGSETSTTREVHLVGSIPLGDVETVFRTVARTVGRCIRRIPDGEVGSRIGWLSWQRDIFARCPQFTALQVDPDWRGGKPWTKFVLNDDAQDAAIDFGPLGYAQEAAASHKIFARLKEEGIVAPDARFQVSLPTPYAVVNVFVDKDSHARTEPHYERAMRNELASLVAAIPAGELAVQWDVAQEIECIASSDPHFFALSREEFAARLARLVGYLPLEADVGIHFCYGDNLHKHFIEPTDMHVMVDMANRLCSAATRPINWFHMPVPRDRVDDAYFAPLQRLNTTDATTLFLGLVHYTDGLAGTLERIAAAERYADSFGIATECGMGRRPPETIEKLLEIHAAAATGR
jgi:hypothetical protein